MGSRRTTNRPFWLVQGGVFCCPSHEGHVLFSSRCWSPERSFPVFSDRGERMCQLCNYPSLMAAWLYTTNGMVSSFVSSISILSSSLSCSQFGLGSSRSVKERTTPSHRTKKITYQWQKRGPDDERDENSMHRSPSPSKSSTPAHVFCIHAANVLFARRFSPCKKSTKRIAHHDGSNSPPEKGPENGSLNGTIDDAGSGSCKENVPLAIACSACSRWSAR